MRISIATLGRFALTALTVAVAAFIAWRFWVYYMEEPWTRDGRLRADVVGIAPDVSGLVSEVLVREHQPVRNGEVLFRIDRARFTLALQQSEAIVASRRASMEEAVRERERYASLSNLSVSQEKQQQKEASAEVAVADYQQALADRAVAKLNLDRAEVIAPVNGTITNFSLQPGDYATAGEAVAALVDTDTFHVDGYFEETKLPRIHIGDKVLVHLMGETTMLHGQVESIAAGIEDRERSAGAKLLPNVNPTFSWVRLAQRVPVRVQLRQVPANVQLISGRTATVTVLPSATEPALADQR